MATAEMSRGVAAITASALGRPPVFPKSEAASVASKAADLASASLASSRMPTPPEASGSSGAASGSSAAPLAASLAASGSSGAASGSSAAPLAASLTASRTPILVPSATGLGSSGAAAAASGSSFAALNENDEEEASVANGMGGDANGENGENEDEELGEAISLEEFKGDCLGRTYCVNKSPEGEYFFDYAVPPQGFDFKDVKYFRVTGASLSEVEAELRRVLGRESNASSTAGINNNNNNNNDGGLPPKNKVGGTGVYIVWKDYILIQRRSLSVGSFTGTITSPGGSVDAKDKTVQAAALRELKEEAQFKVNGAEVKESELDVLESKEIKSGSFTVSFLVVIKQVDMPSVEGPDAAHKNEVMKFDPTQDASLFALPHIAAESPYYLWVKRDKLQEWLFNVANQAYVIGKDGKKNPFRFTLAKLNARLGPPGPNLPPVENENENEGGNGNGAASSSAAAASSSSSGFSSSTTALRTAAALPGSGAGNGGVTAGRTGGPTLGRTLMIPQPQKSRASELFGPRVGIIGSSGTGGPGAGLTTTAAKAAAELGKPTDGGKRRTRKNRKAKN